MSLIISLLTLAILPNIYDIRIAAQRIPESETVLFGSATDFAAVRDCGVCCFEYRAGLGCDFGSQIVRAVGCTVNSCICSRSDVRAIVTTHLQSCISKGCSGGSGDVSVALSVFGGYCNSYLGVEAGTTPAESDGGTSPETVTETRTIPLSTLTTAVGTTTVQIAATTITVFRDGSTPNDVGSNTVTVTAGPSGGLSEPAKIGLGVGIGIGIPIVAILGFIAYKFSTALTAPPEMPHAQPIQGQYVD
ncbi:hypothetical protein TWF730_003193 [Orbilia blumenaviensis]|uniref:Extracellular membrane protein CFEM domain-containing protein n=1 Tax=Orbilia blumenaviensis TaxID=1796055 RepID=A0AAV9U6X0_9PEZI